MLKQLVFKYQLIFVIISQILINQIGKFRAIIFETSSNWIQQISESFHPMKPHRIDGAPSLISLNAGIKYISIVYLRFISFAFWDVVVRRRKCWRTTKQLDPRVVSWKCLANIRFVDVWYMFEFVLNFVIELDGRMAWRYGCCFLFRFRIFFSNNEIKKIKGYLLTGRHGFFSCYEAFIHIVDSMFNQHASKTNKTKTRFFRVVKFVVAKQSGWRRATISNGDDLSHRSTISSLRTFGVRYLFFWRGCLLLLNIELLLSKEHNGSSHEDPGFVDHVVNKKVSRFVLFCLFKMTLFLFFVFVKQGEVIRVYLPPDANTLLAVTDICLRSRNCVNVVVAGNPISILDLSSLRFQLKQFPRQTARSAISRYGRCNQTRHSGTYNSSIRYLHFDWCYTQLGFWHISMGIERSEWRTRW